MRQILLVSVLCLGAAGALIPGLAHAGLTPLHGRQILNTKPLPGVTSSCSCDVQNYTLGFRPGTAKVVVTLMNYQNAMTSEYGIRVTFLQGKKVVGWKQAACLTTQRPCNQSLVFSTRVGKPTIYYLRVQGLGSDGITFLVRPQGPLVRLRCYAHGCTF